ncbi:uncharacterized protein PAC_09920 [Phialocephala subalpina]|uniref:C2H2-type domain-containing protein n=1 Tax=Phialocephala subalpina TaxID=576137 RepID=A0A1L7X4S8_9HELO|nr:uncharacterized protein PAC_09920 [Phialocephala subalpina]
MDRSATEYTQSENTADHASAAQYTPQQEVRPNNFSASATPTSEYGIYPTSARSGSFPEHIQRQYHPASNHSGSSGGMAQSTNPSIAASSPTYPAHGGGQYSPYPPQQDMQHGYPQHPGGAMYTQPRPDWAGYAGQPQHPMHGYAVSGAQTPTSAAPAGARPGQVSTSPEIPRVETPTADGEGLQSPSVELNSPAAAAMQPPSEGLKSPSAEPKAVADAEKKPSAPRSVYVKPPSQPRAPPLHAFPPPPLSHPHHPPAMSGNPTYQGVPPQYGVPLYHGYGPAVPPPMTHGGPLPNAPGAGGRHPLSQVYSFVPIPGAQQHKRPRRRYEEIERMYKCGWNGCEKAYGTLNHLNAHVTMQSHGQKRTPEEFKEIRKEWKARKKEEENARKAEEERSRAAVAPEGQGQEGAPPAGYQQPGRSVQLPPIGYQPNAQVPAQYQAPSGGVQQLQEYGNNHLQYSGYPASPYGAPNQMYNGGPAPKYEQH